MIDPFSIDALPTSPPDQIVAGLRIAWKLSLDYNDTLYSVEYRAPGPVVISGVYNSTNDVWVFTVPGSTSVAWEAGDVRWSAVVVRTSDSEAIEIATGMWTVFTSTSDRRTHAEVMVAKIESVLAGRADADVASYTIKGRSLTKLSPDELMRWRDYYKAEIALTGGSETGSASPRRNTLRVRFT